MRAEPDDEIEIELSGPPDNRAPGRIRPNFMVFECLPRSIILELCGRSRTTRTLLDVAEHRRPALVC